MLYILDIGLLREVLEIWRHFTNIYINIANMTSFVQYLGIIKHLFGRHLIQYCIYFVSVMNIGLGLRPQPILSALGIQIFSRQQLFPQKYIR